MSDNDELNIANRLTEPIPPGWTQADCEAWEERAAIIEIDGGLDRETAEWLAMEEIEERRQDD